MLDIKKSNVRLFRFFYKPLNFFIFISDIFYLNLYKIFISDIIKI
jgi:hypothetical protein